MKYLCLVYLEKDKWSAVPDRECADCGNGLRQRGALLAAEPLHPVETATTVRVRNGGSRSSMDRLPKPRSSSRGSTWSKRGISTRRSSSRRRFHPPERAVLRSGRSENWCPSDHRNGNLRKPVSADESRLNSGHANRSTLGRSTVSISKIRHLQAHAHFFSTGVEVAERGMTSYTLGDRRALQTDVAKRGSWSKALEVGSWGSK